MNNLKDIHNILRLHRMDRVLFYQDVNEQFEGYTQHSQLSIKSIIVVLSGCQWTIWRIYTTPLRLSPYPSRLFYQDVNEQFEGYTQHLCRTWRKWRGCFIRMSMNNLKDIHNRLRLVFLLGLVVLSGCQWTIWRIYTTYNPSQLFLTLLFYQDVNEQFEGYTQQDRWWCQYQHCCFIRMSMNNLKDIHNILRQVVKRVLLFYQDVNEQFEGYTQR